MKILVETNTEYDLIVIPAFTFNFPKDGVFDKEKSEPELGSFPKHLFKSKQLNRSINPFYSFYAFGKKGKDFCETELMDSVGTNSPFYYMHNNKTALVSIGHHYIKSLSSIHQIEYEEQVDYRELLKFRGVVRDNGKKIKEIESNFFGRKYEICDFSGLTDQGRRAIEEESLVKNIANSFNGKYINTQRLDLAGAMKLIRNNDPIKKGLIGAYKKGEKEIDESKMPIMPNKSNEIYMQILENIKKIY